jgi:hypothetical protein
MGKESDLGNKSKIGVEMTKEWKNPPLLIFLLVELPYTHIF